MKASAVKLTEPNNPKLGRTEDPPLYFPPHTNTTHILRDKDPKKNIGWINLLKKQLNIIIGSGTLKIKEQKNPHDVLVSTAESKNIKPI
jgi:hypothetical protein